MQERALLRAGWISRIGFMNSANMVTSVHIANQIRAFEPNRRVMLGPQVSRDYQLSFKCHCGPAALETLRSKGIRGEAGSQARD